ncbi:MULTISPECIES: ribosome assembly RNA-binding protein YhbY [Leuconostoc]|jgi:RNA-binding protein|uniref:Ribosome assembly RNA-binding protein YhbY n=1 Tax=Leuconostoc pseudomesenteroides TaxID=33968 RepID=A0A5B8T7F5_LEUPS|nr:MULTISPECIES: ribosome assembly RNA-binding protein YhbY [Leuconostoc]MCC8439925.1 ribosome assembly RNA-binding protein YhbY [Leuconostoc pseudomesenteroides]MCT4388157.1 ribosome assembly RNA-binding protein YhbY [Leuconostoc pseudomesenteroides]MDG9733214.1 ribosome assembly RNA-binding protein YhbY [Leuconostoc pseudomesenteroides]MDN2450237.1 ribosome assembly RNA-binding protein YhbY [Leuconostoc sp. UCMA20149]NKZ36754.1 ribosome assembly RNA-binding protein YhbY [Leuconostoc pseudome
MTLTGKQKRFLRSQANTLSPIFSVGKNGLTTTWLEELVMAIAKRELIKISLQQGSEETVDSVADYIETHSDISVVQTIGRTIVLYLPAVEEKYQKVSVALEKI